MNASVRAAAILAGGLASRMGGQPKSFLEVGGQRIIDRQLRVLRELADEIVIVANQPERYLDLGVKVVADDVPGRPGPLAGIAAALAAISPDAAGALVVACDMPYLAAAPLQAIIAAAAGVDAAVARVSGRPEPLCAFYGRACGPVARAVLAEGEGRVAIMLSRVNLRWIEEAALRAIDPELRFLENLNTPEDLGRQR